MLVEQQHVASDAETTALVERSRSALAAGDRRDAEGLARLATSRDPKYVPAWLALGQALEAQKRHAEAATVYAEIARISPFSSGVSRSLRRVWLGPLAGFGVVAAVLWGILRVVGGHFEQRTVLIGLLLSTAVLIVGVLTISWRHRRRFAGLTGADRELMKAHGAGGLLSGPAPGRLLAAGLVIVALSAAAVVFAVGTKPSLAMGVGDCFTMTKRTSVQQISAIPCDLPHITEIFAVFTDAAPSGAPFPGIEVVRTAATPFCRQAYTSFIGEPYDERSRLWINILSPERPYWDRGIRTSFCAVEDPNGEQVTGSAGGAGR